MRGRGRGRGYGNGRGRRHFSGHSRGRSRGRGRGRQATVDFIDSSEDSDPTRAEESPPNSRARGSPTRGGGSQTNTVITTSPSDLVVAAVGTEQAESIRNRGTQPVFSVRPDNPIPVALRAGHAEQARLINTISDTSGAGTYEAEPRVGDTSGPGTSRVEGGRGLPGTLRTIFSLKVLRRHI